MLSPLSKYIIIFVVMASAALGLFAAGGTYENMVNAEKAVEQANKNAQAMAEEVKLTEAKTKEIYERKIRLMQTKLSAGCDLGADYRVLHDSAAGAESAAQGSVTSQTFARHVADNYAICLQNAAWLVECQNLCR